MLFEDCTARGTSFAKDPCVVWFQGCYWMYYTRPQPKAEGPDAYEIGIGRSADLEQWEIVGGMAAEQPAEGRGVCAPGAIVLDGVLHLFYQSYGQFPRDFICHATSTDGLRFARDPSNPIVQPMGAWNNGRAIDADVVVHQGQLLLYWATRDPQGKRQMLGVSSAPLGSDFSKACWAQRCDQSILAPELDWEQDCIEAAAAVAKDGKVYLFYAGAYNCAPQQVGCAVSEDGLRFTRLSDQPLLRHGAPGTWNACESGHPYAFEHEGRYWLFYQGSDDRGKTWRLSRAEIQWDGQGMPRILA